MRELNVKHINKVLDHIRKDTRRLYMRWWGVKKGTRGAAQEGLRNFAPCGTACCFAGWSKLLSVPKKEWGRQFDPIGIMHLDAYAEGERLGLLEEEWTRLFRPVSGNPQTQFKVVKERLREIIAVRKSEGQDYGKRIHV